MGVNVEYNVGNLLDAQRLRKENGLSTVGG